MMMLPRRCIRPIHMIPIIGIKNDFIRNEPRSRIDHFILLAVCGRYEYTVSLY
jgi:hypothetical protein